MKDVEKAFNFLEKQTETNFGELIWKGHDNLSGSYYTADITETELSQQLSLLFKTLSLRASVYIHDNCTMWTFEFAYTHPAGGSNGKTIGTVYEQEGIFVYRGEGE